MITSPKELHIRLNTINASLSSKDSVAVSFILNELEAIQEKVTEVIGYDKNVLDELETTIGNINKIILRQESFSAEFEGLGVEYISSRGYKITIKVGDNTHEINSSIYFILKRLLTNVGIPQELNYHTSSVHIPVIKQLLGCEVHKLRGQGHYIGDLVLEENNKEVIGTFDIGSDHFIVKSVGEDKHIIYLKGKELTSEFIIPKNVYQTFIDLLSGELRMMNPMLKSILEQNTPFTKERIHGVIQIVLRKGEKLISDEVTELEEGEVTFLLGGSRVVLGTYPNATQGKKYGYIYKLGDKLMHKAIGKANYEFLLSLSIGNEIKGGAGITLTGLKTMLTSIGINNWYTQYSKSGVTHYVLK